MTLDFNHFEVTGKYKLDIPFIPLSQIKVTPSKAPGLPKPKGGYAYMCDGDIIEVEEEDTELANLFHALHNYTAPPGCKSALIEYTLMKRIIQRMNELGRN